MVIEPMPNIAEAASAATPMRAAERRRPRHEAWVDVDDFMYSLSLIPMRMDRFAACKSRATGV
jgi:hypothetical protein